MPRITPHMLATTMPERPTMRPKRRETTPTMRVQRIREDETILRERQMNYVRQTMHGRYGVRF